MAFFLRPGYDDDHSEDYDDDHDDELSEMVGADSLIGDDEAADLATTAAVMTDQTPLTIHITIMQAWILISAVQLTCRHPNLGQPLKDALEHAARQFQAAITEVHPEAAELLEKGWHAEYDR